MNKKDNIFKKLNNQEFDFVFDESVVSVFDDMINRSIPHYKEMQDLIVYFCDTFLNEDFRLLDLGSSLGYTIFNIAEKSTKKNFKLIGVDSSIQMIEESKKKKSLLYPKKNIQFIKSEINDNILLKNDYNAIVSCLTMQFIRPIEREEVMTSIFESLKTKGIFILIEKTVINDSSLNRYFIERYHKFKKDNGYSETEIYKKRLSLENVLIPYSIEENKSMLKKSGFNEVETFFQWLNFTGFIAIKK